ncbi:MAG: sel1 repeat family protein [Bauldia sp.]|nr:sel1 repeat family protein [Bauldia sp.]
MPSRSTVAAILLPAAAGLMLIATAMPLAAQPLETPAEACDRIAGHPDDADTIGAGVLIEDVDLAAAEEACGAAVEADPNNRHATFTLGRILQYQGNFEGALPLFERAATAGSTIATTWLGHAYWDGNGVAQDYARAVEYYRAAADLGSSDALVFIAFAYQLGLGVEENAATAAETYRLAIEAGNESARLYLADLLGGLDATDDEFAEAVAIYEALIDEDGDRAPSARNNLAYAWSQRGENLEEAEALAVAAMDTMAEDDLSLRAATLDTLAAIRMQLGRLNEAFGDIKAALAIDPMRVEHWDRLGDISLMLERETDAVRAWQRALELYLADPTGVGADWDVEALRHKIDEHLVRG